MKITCLFCLLTFGNAFINIVQNVKFKHKLYSQFADQSYNQLLEVMLNSNSTIVEKNYNKCTIEFLDVLENRLFTEKKEQIKSKLIEIQNNVKSIMQERLNLASERFQELVKSPNIQEKISSMLEHEQIDEPIILLMKSNLQQAQKANATHAIHFFSNMIKYTQDAMDDKLTPCKILLRQLFRESNMSKRKELMYEAFRTRKPMLLADGSKTSPMPNVKPPEFMNELEIMMKNFGNIPEIQQKFTTFIEEAENVIVSIYGESMTTKQQQDYMWKQRSISVFDLEKLELDAEKNGKSMPWESKNNNLEKLGITI